MKKKYLFFALFLMLSTITKAELFDIQMNFNVEDSSGLNGNAAVCFTGTEFWTAIWNSNQLNRFDNTGSYVNTFVIPTISGIRSMAVNGTDVYIANNSDTIFVVDIAAATVSSVIVLANTVRYITFDPSANSGLGGFWAGSWSGDIRLYDLSGNELHSIATATHGYSLIYSIAYDNYTADGPYLWVFYQGASTSSALLDRFDLATESRANLNIEVDVDFSYPGSLAGGLFITDALVSGEWSIGGMLQATPENVFVYELNDLILPFNDVEVSNASINDDLTEYPLNHAISNLTFFTELKNKGGNELDSVKISIEVLNSLNTVVYQDEKIFYNLILGNITPVSFTSMVPEIGEFSVVVAAELLGNADTILTNNSTTFNFAITEEQMSRDFNSFSSNPYRISGDNWGYVVARYDLAVQDSLGVINIQFTNPNSGDSTYGMIFSNQGGEPGTLIAQTPKFAINGTELDLWFEDTVILAAGSYFFGVYEPPFSGINLAQSTNNFKENVNFYSTLGGNWIESGIATARAIHPRFNWDDVNCSIFNTSLTRTTGIVHLGDLVTLTATPSKPNVQSVFWTKNGTVVSGATDLDYIHVSNTIGNQNYAVTLESTDGCIATKTLSFQVKDTVTAIRNVTDFDYIKTYPNPVVDNLTIHLQKNINNFSQAVIYTLKGSVVKEFTLNKNGTTNVSLQNIAKGLYIVKLIGKRQTAITQIAVE